MEIEVRSVGYIQIPADARVVVSEQQLVGADFSGRRLECFTSVGSRFERCDFSGMVSKSTAFGAGTQVSEYVGCNFDGAKLMMGAGGNARFVDCSFDKTTIQSWFCFEVELIDCQFTGRLRKVIFNGTVPPDRQVDVGRLRNCFEGNDFSQADLFDVGFRTGIDLSKQRLPDGDEYVYLPDAAAAIARARLACDAWTDPEDKDAVRGVLKVMQEDVADGQKQMLMRADDYARRDREAIRKMLEAARAQ